MQKSTKRSSQKRKLQPLVSTDKARKLICLYLHIIVSSLKSLMKIKYKYAVAVVKTLSVFLSSISPEISAYHVPYNFKVKQKLDISKVVEYTNEFWRRMKDPQDLRIKMWHDGYLNVMTSSFSSPSLCFAICFYWSISSFSSIYMTFLQTKKRHRWRKAMIWY
jgi:hypothetical protein